MDTEKLLNVLNDVLSENKDNQIAEKLSELVNHINESINSNTAEAINITIEEIKNLVANSIFNTYSISNNKILEKIGGKQFAGNGLIENIENIILKSNFPKQQIDELNQFIENRKNFIRKIQQTNNNLKELNFETIYQINNDNYEIGILIPIDKKLNTIKNINLILKDFDFLFSHLIQIVNNESVDIVIENVSNGSLKFDIKGSIILAAAVMTILGGVTEIYKNIDEIRKTRNKLESLEGITKIEKKESEEKEKEIINKKIECIASKIIEEYYKENNKDRTNELLTGTKKGIIFLVKHIEQGIQVEINPPRLNEPEELEEKTIENKDKENNRVTFTDSTTMTIDEHKEYQKEIQNKKKVLLEFEKTKNVHQEIITTSQEIQNLKIENLNIINLIYKKDDIKNDKNVNTKENKNQTQ